MLARGQIGEPCAENEELCMCVYLFLVCRPNERVKKK
jgi:hypothetical protein